MNDEPKEIKIEEIPIAINQQLLTELYKSLADEVHMLKEFQNKVVAIARQDCPPEYKEEDLLDLLEDYKL